MKKVVVIGAGPAGLTAAYELLKSKQYEVFILEKDTVVGGISKTIPFDEEHLIDTGIHRFFSKSDTINQIWQEILPLQSAPAYDEIQLHKKRDFAKNGSNPETDRKSLLIKDRYTRIYYRKKFYDYPITLKFSNIKNLGVVTVLRAGISYIKAKMFPKKEDSLENFYINRFGQVLYHIFFENYTEKVWGIHPSKISADWGEQRVKGVSIAEVLKDAIKKVFHIKDKHNTETSLIENFYYPKLGAGQMWEEMAEKIKEMGGNIILQAEVSTIGVEGDNISYVKYKHEGKEVIEKADILVSSMPIKNLIERLEHIKIPENIYETAVNLPYREFMSVGILVKKIQLTNNTPVQTIGNIVPDNWIYIQDANVKVGRMQIFNNWSPYLFQHPDNLESHVLISLEYFCSENDTYWNMSEEEFCAFAEKEAVQIGIVEEQDIIKSKRIKIEKAYPAYFGTYKDIGMVITYLNSFKNLYCIGRNGQHRYNNMDHSMMTGIETAHTIIKQKNSKEDIWAVNTEKEYHEIKYVNNKKTI